MGQRRSRLHRWSLAACAATAAAAGAMGVAASVSPSVPVVAAAAAPENQSQQNALFAHDMVDFLQYQVCATPALSGSVHDSACSYEVVDKAVAEHFHPLLLELSRLSFFRHFKVDLGKACPFWPDDDGMCASVDCAVCECPTHEIPAKWFLMDQQFKHARRSPTSVPATASEPCADQTGESELSRVDRTNAEAGESFRAWEERPRADLWGAQGDEGERMAYIDLLKNPERYTGYSGIQAERVWHAIYEENCFTPPDEASVTGMCLEERVYYRLISGLQASINTHISLRYKYGDDSWGVNPALFVHRVGKHRERLQNLYFTYLFVMRAIGRYRHQLLEYDYDTGNDGDDARVVEILRTLVLEDRAVDGATGSTASCPTELTSVLSGFDERALFKVDSEGLSADQLVTALEEKRQLEEQFRGKFQNVSRIMDCVTCEKCRLWGKIQTMGIGTAIKILLVDDVADLEALNRNELIALINVANNLARSVDGVKMMRQLEFVAAVKQVAVICGGASLVVALLIFIVRKVNARQQARRRRRKAD